MSGKRTQYRAQCTVCLRSYAVKGIAMVAHGYSLPQGWHQQVGSCHGAHRAHWGTVEGRDFARQVVETIQIALQSDTQRHSDLEHGLIIEATVHRRGEPARLVQAGDPDWPKVLEHEQALCRQRMRAAQADIQAFNARIAVWHPREPKAVTVDATPPALMHAYSVHYHGRLCASSMNGAARGLTTRKHDEVNCEKCLQRLQKFAARKAAG